MQSSQRLAYIAVSVFTSTFPRIYYHQQNNMTVRNIVFVDDDHEDSEFFTTAMRQLNPELNIAVAFSAAEMYESLDNQVPDLLFIDSFLQEQSGHDNIENIRKRANCQSLPIIMYTGSSDVRLIRKAFQAGATAYLVKPHSLQQIKKMMERLLQIAASDELPSLKDMYYMDGSFHKAEQHH